MQMTMRWFGADRDSVTLKQIRQVPGVTGIVAALHGLPAGEPWPLRDILKLKKEISDAGFTMECIESVNVHEDIKLGLPSRDKYIENYKESLRNLGRAGVRVVCYNFMPVFDWTRTDLAADAGGGATCLAYDGERIEGKSPEEMFRETDGASHGYALPGWEPERLGGIKKLFEKYRGVTEEKLRGNLVYFLERIMPVCEEFGVKMAIHPDDPPWGIFGLPRIITGEKALRRLFSDVPSRCNGLTLCTGSLGADPQNDIPALIRAVGDRIYFAHLRNVRTQGRRFYETAHESACGSLDMYEIVRALQETGFDGYIRPDHGRMIWGEVARPGYGLYDRALGAAYLNGLWEGVKKSRAECELQGNERGRVG